MVKRFFERIYLLLIFAFLYAPIVVLMAFSFNESKSRSMWTGFSLKWYEKVFQNSEIMSALYYTLLIAVLSAVIATVIGTISAIGIHSLGKWPKKLALDVNYLPVLNPDIVTGVSLMILFIFINMRLGFLTLLLSHIVFNIPYVIISVLPKLRQLDKNIYEAALDLGATPAYAIRRVVLPQIMPGVITGLLLAFTLSLDDFVISFFTTGSGVTNLSITIYSMTRRGVSPEINAISTLMFAVVLVLLVVINGRMSQDKNVSRRDNIE